jgi:hypothetical protein
MSYSTVAYSSSVVSRPKRASRKSISQNLLGGTAIACLVLGCAWTVYTNVFRADVYPQLGSSNFDAPVVRRPAVAAREAQMVVSDAFAALREQAPPAASLAPSSTLTFGDRFAAAAPQGVEPKPQSETAGLAEAPKPQPERAKLADAAKPRSEAAKLAEAPKTRAPAPVQVAALPPQRAADAPAAKSPGTTVRDMAQRAKAAVMSLATNERQSISEKLWGKQPSTHNSLLAYASADASITGSLGSELAQPQNPALGGSAPYDRSTAVYDISAHTVYLPDGSKLEAHSGLGSELDDPRSARIRMRGVTPPHIYELKPREALFHGVPALRLTPIGGEEAIYGRSGLLAHTYMLGPNGDSNGCVSFKDYNAFLSAYRNQGIKRLAVVARVE